MVVGVDTRLVADNTAGGVHRCTCRGGFADFEGFYIRFYSVPSFRKGSMLSHVQGIGPEGAFCLLGLRSRHIG